MVVLSMVTENQFDNHLVRLRRPDIKYIKKTKKELLNRTK